MTETRTIAGHALPLTLPPVDADARTLREHFGRVQDVIACTPYETAITLCQSCGREGENMTGKATNPAGRHRFCSADCETLRERYERLRARDVPAVAVAVRPVAPIRPSDDERRERRLAKRRERRAAKRAEKGDA